MAKLIEHSKAPSLSTDLRGLTGRRPLPCVCGKWTGSGSPNCPGRNRRATGVENAPKSSIMMNSAELGNPVPSPYLGRLTARHAVGGLEQDAERSECLVVMIKIPGETFSAPQGGRRSAGLRSRKHRMNRMKAENANDGFKAGALCMPMLFRQSESNVKCINLKMCGYSTKDTFMKA